jgi:membrane associated rhomboid family serine protease
VRWDPNHSAGTELLERVLAFPSYGRGVEPIVAPSSQVSTKETIVTTIRKGAVAVGVLIALLWLIEGIDTVLHHRLDRFGVRPHRISGLRGIVFAPFLHVSWNHLISNTVPLAVLALIIAGQSLVRFVSVSAMVALISGLGMWVFGSTNSVHIGASGVIFGLLTYLIARGLFARKLAFIAIGVVVGALYGGILAGVVPTKSGVSWQGHLFGAIGGVVAAYLLDRRRPDPSNALPQ